MKNLTCVLSLSFLCLLFFVPDFFPAYKLSINTIEGRVYGPDRTPVNKADVELYNDVGSFIAHTQTDTGGRFTFLVPSSGRFTVRVLAFQYDYREETQDVELVTLTRFSSDRQYIDFYLRPNRRETVNSIPPDTIFVQEIPQKAKQLYESGVGSLSKDPEKAFAQIDEAITIFPTYFDALSFLGKEYINRKNYKKGYPYLLKAIDVNSRNLSNYYSLGIAFLQLNEISAAIEAAKATVVINSSCIDCQLLYGTALRLDKKYTDAEKALVKAKSLSKKPNPEVYYQLALVYNKLNRNQEAANELESYLKVLPDKKAKKDIEDLISKLRATK